MSHNLENNKLFAALLVAGIVAMLSGFVAKKIVHPHVPEKSAITVDTSALEAAQSGGPAAPTGPEPILALLANADLAKGEALHKACLACHGFEKGGPNKVGPNLWGVVNGPKAHRADFAYSDTIKEMAAKGDKWTYQNLNAFLYKPAAYAPGTKMSYPGLKKPEDRAALIAYLRAQSDSPAALPSEAEIAAEAPKEAPKAEEATPAPAATAVDTDTGADKATAPAADAPATPAAPQTN